MSNVIASNGYLGITNIIFDTDDSVELEDGTVCQIHYDEMGEAFFEYKEQLYFLNEFVRLERH